MTHTEFSKRFIIKGIQLCSTCVFFTCIHNTNLSCIPLRWLILICYSMPIVKLTGYIHTFVAKRLCISWSTSTITVPRCWIAGNVIQAVSTAQVAATSTECSHFTTCHQLKSNRTLLTWLSLQWCIDVLTLLLRHNWFDCMILWCHLSIMT